MAKYKPGAIVLQLGADSISQDLLGKLNLSNRGHGQTLKQMKKYGVPLLLLGGGGYNVQNVSRLWAYETGLALEEELEGTIPKTDKFYECYVSDNRLHVPVKSMKNKNTPDYLQEVKEKAMEYLRYLEYAPSVSYHNVPSSLFD